MDASNPTLPAPRPRRRRGWRDAGLSFLTLSIAAHLLFGLGATHFVVQVITPKKKPGFAPGPVAAPGPAQRALEHKVSLAKKQQAMSAPPASRRVVTTGLSPVALPALPALRTDAPATPMVMAGMGGSGANLGGFGAAGGSAGGGGGLSLFGLRARTGGSLVGHLYDLKQDRSRKPTNVSAEQYASVVRQFVGGGFNAAVLNLYFQASATLYASQIFTPGINADEAPKAFGVQNEVQPKLWLAVYRGRVIPAESGTYHFVGFGDDVLVVRFNNRVVLDRGYLNPSGLRSSKVFVYTFDSGTWYTDSRHNGGHGLGLPMEVKAGESYDLQILIGEQPGGQSLFQLLIEKEGVEYAKDGAGNPILPVFRVGNASPPTPGSQFPPFAADGPVWKAELPPLTAAAGP